MKNYKKSDYAINKYNKAIVYKFSDCILEVTFEKISAENPNFTKEDFEALKQISDAMYYEQVLNDHKEDAHKLQILNNEDHSEDLATLPLEDMLFSDNERYPSLQELYMAFDKCLSEVQKRRFILHKIKGLSTVAIARKEGINQNAVWKSIQHAEKKLKKFFKKGW